MKRVFVRLFEFEKQCKQINIDEDDITAIEEELINNPTKGSVISGTGGIRKLRVKLPNRGKKGGARVIYVDFLRYEKTYFLTAYGKSKIEDLTSDEKKDLKTIVILLEDELRKKDVK